MFVLQNDLLSRVYMKRIFLINSIAFLCFTLVFSQTQENLLTQLKLEKLAPKEQVTRLKNLIEINLYSDTIKSNFYNKILLKISKKNNFKYEIGCHYYYEIVKLTSNSNFNVKATFFNIKKAKWYFYKSNSFDEYLSVIYSECITLSKIGKLDEARKLAFKTINQFKSKKHLGIGFIYYFLAEDDLKEKKYKSAFKNVKTALNFYNKSKDEYSKAQCIVFMGDMAFELQNYSESINYFQSVFLKHPVLISDASYQLIINHRLARCYIKSRDYKNAIKYSDRAQLYLKQVAMKADLCDAYIIKADALNSLGYTKLALEQIYKAESILKEVKDERNLRYINLVKSKVYYKLGDFNNAMYFIKKNLKLKNIDSNTYLEVSNIQSKLKNYNEAYLYMKKFHNSKINELNTNNGNIIVELEALYNLKNKELVVQRLRNRDLQKDINIKKQDEKLSYAISISVILLIMLAFGYYIYRIRTKVSQILKYKNQKLESINELLNKSLREKELLLKEIHHRVKNNLQLVSSILNIQANESPTISVNEFLDKCQNRISSIALIHQNLYVTENLDKVDFQIYVEDLSNCILSSFSDKESIRYEILANGNCFNIQTSISLGLIISELSCNAIKYAFRDKKEGIIFIEINKLADNKFELIFGDNGCGQIDKTETSISIGLELVNLLAMQLNGEFVKLDKPGTFYRISFEEINN
jgi:two-component sensor histidine kinase/ribosomal protein S26